MRWMILLLSQEKPTITDSLGQDQLSCTRCRTTFIDVSNHFSLSQWRKKIVIGASGGPLIITSTLQVILNIIDFDLEPSQVPILEVDPSPVGTRKLFVDDGLSSDVKIALEQKGHTIATMPLNASVQVIHCIESVVMRHLIQERGKPSGLY